MISFSQKKSSFYELNDSVEYYIKHRNILKATSLIKKMQLLKKESTNENYQIDKNIFYIHFLLNNIDSCKIQLHRIENYKDKLTYKNLANYYTNLAYLNKKTNNLDTSINNYLNALNVLKKDDYKEKTTIYAGLSGLYGQINNTEKEFNYIKLYVNEAYKNSDKTKIGYALNNLAFFYDKTNQPDKAISNFKKALNYVNRKSTKNIIYQNIGSILLNHYNKKDSAKYYFKKALNNNTSKRTLAFIHKDLALIQKRNKNFIQENKELHLALNNITKDDSYNQLKVVIYKLLSENNYNLKRFKESVNYLKKFNTLNDSLKNTEVIKRVEELETKYQTAKKDKRILVIENKRKINLYLLIASVFFLILVISSSVFFLKNSKKKRLLAEQQQQLEAQKNITLLRKQELNALDAMLEGQEKERKRIAEDLHDNIGSVLATLKLHFENLKLNREKKQFNQEELYEKTEKLIDETYLKIRSIAHAKNSGVIANKGLLVALKLMAEKVSSANKTSIEVVDFGLDSRLENSIEIAVFRIIQELITNIIKHANAKNATINISNFKESLNIIIEDDGKGFDYNKVELKNGMGLNSIKTRVKHLNGTFNVDSSLGNGTSIIINIPL